MSFFGNKIGSLLSHDRLCNLIKYSQLGARAGGYLAEFGVYSGGSLEVIARFNPGVEILAFDSFQGVPKESDYDFHREGDFGNVDYHAIAGYFKMVYPTVRVVRGFSPDVFSICDAHTRFGFVHMDVDMYYSVLHGLDFFLPRMNPGGVVLIDDYKVNSTPGCKRAVEEFMSNNPNCCRYHGEVTNFPGFEGDVTNNQYVIYK